ncbi:MAG: ABC transporter ATP-binding protein [Nitrososphaerales archaeon]
MRKTLLKIEGLSSGYGGIDILKDVSFEVKEFEVACIIGPNGAGKSTLIKTVYGLLKPSSGKITFKDEDITGLSPLNILKKGISYLPQGRAIFPLMTVQENLEMGVFSRRDTKIKEDIAKIYDKFPILKERRNQLAGNLSGGEQQILAIAMALLLSPTLMMLDEPSLGLSPQSMSIIFETIKALNKSGITLLMVEQNAKKALQLADHAIVLELGRKRFEGSGQEVLSNPELKKLYLGG